MAHKRSHIVLAILAPVLGLLLSALAASLMTPQEPRTFVFFLSMSLVMLFPWIVLGIIGLVLFFKKSLRACLIFNGASLAALLLIMGGCFSAFRG